MAGEACFSILTTPTKAHSTQFLNPRSFAAARLKTSFISTAHPNPFLSLASKSDSSSKPAPSAGFGKKAKKKVQDDPWESLFQQLEKDLENDTEDINEEEITEEDVANFERELDMVVEDLANASTSNGIANELDDMLRAQNKDIIKDEDEDEDDSNLDDEDGINAKKGNEDDDDDGAKDNDDDEGADYDDEDLSDDDFEEPRKVTLQKWQLRKLAAAVALGRRKVHIKSLAAELQLDRDDVLYFLKTPPPELLMVASEMEEDAGEDDEPVSNEEEIMADDEQKEVNQAIPSTNGSDLDEIEKVQKQIYGPRDWMKGKRIKKINIATLERVYTRSKWPSNAMVENLVRATNLPRVRILEWFEEERAKSGVKDPPRQSAASRKSWKKPVTHSFERLP